ncbi:hypothetical protein BV898_19264 [Hypsibius exemplaris]|uniref:Kazal-like domain-containing protein n=1 Tax=Hypsibius exemplaris TaxID=2072580 RepID=A0A9X6NJ85_HYPEX|nr:hypothetical protein BV898_19264 [Hypsibius exemplaris]
MSRLLFFLVAALISGVCLAQKEDQQPGNCTCRAPPPPSPGKDDVGIMDDNDDEPPMMMMMGDDEDAPPPPPPPRMDGKRAPPPPHPPHEGKKWRNHHKRPQVCGTDGKEYPDRCNFINAQASDAKLGERPCEKKHDKKPIPHCLNNGTTLNIDRRELDKMLKTSPISLGLLCPGACPCALKCPPPPPPPPPHGAPNRNETRDHGPKKNEKH